MNLNVEVTTSTSGTGSVLNEVSDAISTATGLPSTDISVSASSSSGGDSGDALSLGRRRALSAKSTTRRLAHPGAGIAGGIHFGRRAHSVPPTHMHSLILAGASASADADSRSRRLGSASGGNTLYDVSAIRGPTFVPPGISAVDVHFEAPASASDGHGGRALAVTTQSDPVKVMVKVTIRVNSPAQANTLSNQLARTFQQRTTNSTNGSRRRALGASTATSASSTTITVVSSTVVQPGTLASTAASAGDSVVAQPGSPMETRPYAGSDEDSLALNAYSDGGSTDWRILSTLALRKLWKSIVAIWAVIYDYAYLAARNYKTLGALAVLVLLFGRASLARREALAAPTRRQKNKRLTHPFPPHTVCIGKYWDGPRRAAWLKKVARGEIVVHGAELDDHVLNKNGVTREELAAAVPQRVGLEGFDDGQADSLWPVKVFAWASRSFYSLTGRERPAPPGLRLFRSAAKQNLDHALANIAAQRAAAATTSASTVIHNPLMVRKESSRFAVASLMARSNASGPHANV